MTDLGQWAPDVVVGRVGQRLALIRYSTGRTFWCRITSAADVSWHDLLRAPVSPALDRVRQLLIDERLIAPDGCRSPDDDPIGAIDLGRVLSNGGQVPHDADRPRLVHIRDEVLVLPPDANPIEVRRAVRLFVSGVEPLARRACYADGLVNRRISVRQDSASSHQLALITSVATGVDRPTCFSFGAGDDKPAAHELGKSPGRLHPCQSVCPQDRGRIGLHVAEAGVATPNLALLKSSERLAAWGVDADPGIARAKAMSEALERFAISDVPAALHVGRAVDLRPNFLDPTTIVDFTPSQRSRNPWMRGFDADEEYRWVKGVTSSGRPIWVLADLVYAGLPARLGRYNGVFHRATSSGVACAEGDDVAKLRALTELLERDAFMRSWLAKTPGTEVGDAASVRRDLGWQDPDFELNLRRLESRALAVVLAVARSRAGGAIFGLGAHHSEELALRKAAMEVATAAVLLGERPPAPAPEEIRTPSQHMLLHLDPRNAHHTAFWTNPVLSFPACGTKVSASLESLLADAVFVPLRNIGADGHVVWRCLHPGLVPLTFGFDCEPLGLAIVRELLGSPPEPAASLFPHPLG